MTTIIVSTADGEDTIAVAGEVSDYDAAIKRHGYDPDSVEYEVQKGPQDRLRDLEEAAGVGDKGPKSGIAHRIDDLEQRVSDLEDKL